MKKKLEVNNEWLRFKERLFKKGCKLPPMQSVEMKRAFFGGFGQAIHLMHTKVNDMTEDEAVKAIDELYKEVETFWNRQIHYQIKPDLN